MRGRDAMRCEIEKVTVTVTVTIHVPARSRIRLDKYIFVGICT